MASDGEQTSNEDPLSDAALLGTSSIVLLSTIAPWLLNSPNSGDFSTDEGESRRLKERAQDVLISRILWPEGKEGETGSKKILIESGVIPPLTDHSAEGLTLLALSFACTTTGGKQGKERSVNEGGKKTWDAELTPREAAVFLSSVPDRLGTQAPKLLQPQLFFPKLLQGCFSAIDDRWAELVREHGSDTTACEAAQSDGTFEFVSTVLVKMCRRGQADRVASSTLLAFLRSTAPPRTQGEIHPPSSDPSCFLDGTWQAVASLVASDAAALERWTEALLRAADKASLNDSAAERLLWALFGRLLFSSPTVRQLFTEQLLLRKVLPHRCIRWSVRFVIVNPPASQESGHVLARIAKVWGGPEWVRNAPLQQQSCVSAALALGVSGLTKEGLEKTPELLSLLLRGVSTRLDSPLWDTRVLGMKVATAFSTVLDPKNPLVFDEQADVSGGDEDWGWASLDAAPAGSKLAVAQLRKEETVWEREAFAALRGSGSAAAPTADADADAAAAAAADGLEASTSGRQSRSEGARVDLLLADDDDDGGANVLWPGGSAAAAAAVDADGAARRPLIEELSAPRRPIPPPDDDEPDSDDDSVTSLPPYDLEDDVAEDVADEKVPTQLRQCAAALRKKEDWEGVERALAAAEGLVRADGDELGDVSLEIARALLHVRVSEFSVDGEEDQHEERRYRALVALLAHATSPVVAFLTSEVYSPHLDVHQRLLIMDVLQGAAQELAGLKVATLEAPPSPSTLETPPPQACNPTPWKEIDGPGGATWSHAYERELPLRANQKRVGKSRYWGKPDRETLTRVVKNRFAPVAAAFMLPLMKDFDRRSHGVDWLGRDFLVLGRFLHLLGTLVECSAPSVETQPLAAALLDLLRIRVISAHVEPYVRRQALFAAASVLMALAPAQVIAALVGDQSPVAQGLDWVRNWAAEVAEKDPDEACREMGEACLQLQSNLAVRAMEVIQATAPSAANPALLASVSVPSPETPTLRAERSQPGPRVQLLG